MFSLHSKNHPAEVLVPYCRIESLSIMVTTTLIANLTFIEKCGWQPISSPKSIYITYSLWSKPGW